MIPKKTVLTICGLALCLGASQVHAKKDKPDEELIAARQKFFGEENVDPKTGAVAKDKVIASWLTNTTYAMSFRGRVALFDSFATRLEVEPGRTSFVIKDLVDLKPEAIFIGHGHGDHADNAAYIAAKTGAHIYASEEECPVMQFDLDRMKNDPLIQGDPVAAIDPGATVECTPVTSVGSAPGSELVRLSALGSDVCVLGFRHLHSILVDPDPDFAQNPVEVTVDPRDDILFPSGTPLTPSSSGTPLPGQMDLRTARGFGSNPGGAVAIAYQFIVRGGPNFSIIWTNSNGALREGKGREYDGTPADGLRLVDLMRNVLPQNDVFMGITSTGNYPNNALRDTVMYTEALRPRVFIPGHHTTGTVGREGTSPALFETLRTQFEIMEAPVAIPLDPDNVGIPPWPGFSREEWPDFRWLTDPMDYTKPIVFDPKSKYWSEGKSDRKERARRVAQLCK